MTCEDSFIVFFRLNYFDEHIFLILYNRSSNLSFLRESDTEVQPNPFEEVAMSPDVVS